MKGKCYSPPVDLNRYSTAPNNDDYGLNGNIASLKEKYLRFLENTKELENIPVKKLCDNLMDLITRTVFVIHSLDKTAEIKNRCMSDSDYERIWDDLAKRYEKIGIKKEKIFQLYYRRFLHRQRMKP